MLNGLYDNPQPASYGYQAPTYGYGSPPSLSYGYQRPAAIYAPAPNHRDVYDGGRQRQPPHAGRFDRRHDRH